MKRAGIKPLAKSSRHKMSMSPSLYFPTAVIGLVKTIQDNPQHGKSAEDMLRSEQHTRW